LIPPSFSRRVFLFAAIPPLRLNRKLRLALIGFDGHVQEIVDQLPNLPDVELTAVAGANSDPAAKASNMRRPVVARAKFYNTTADLLATERLDLAAVCNNDGERAAAIMACIDKGLNVIAEKPLGLSRAEFTEIEAAAAKAKVKVGALLPMRFDPPYLAMKRIVESGEIGEIAQIDAQKSYQLGPRPAWQKRKELYGSTILWIGIHMIDLMLWTSGRRFTEAASLQSTVGIPDYGDMENVTASIFRLDNKGTATLRMDYLRPMTAPGHGDDRLRLAGSKGIVEYQEATGVTLLSQGGPPRVISKLPEQGSVFVDFIRSTYLGEKPALPWTEIRAAHEVTYAAQEAAVRHEMVRVGGSK
jgi:predicted dehydrogenase